MRCFPLRAREARILSRSAAWIVIILPIALATANAGDALSPEITDLVGDERATRSLCASPESFDVTGAYFAMPNETMLLATLQLTAFDRPLTNAGTLTRCHWAVVWSTPVARFAAHLRRDPALERDAAWLSEFQDVDGPSPYPMFRDVEEINWSSPPEGPAVLVFEIPAALVFHDGVHTLERPFALTFSPAVQDDELADVLWVRQLDEEPELIDRAPDCRVGNVTCTAWGADFVSPFHAPPLVEASPPAASQAADESAPAPADASSPDGEGIERATAPEEVQPMGTQAPSAVPWWANEVAQATVGLVGLLVSALWAIFALLRVRRRRDLVALLLRRIEAANTDHRQRPDVGASLLGEIRSELRVHHAKQRIEDGQFLELDRRAASYQTGLRLRLVDTAFGLPASLRDAVHAALRDDTLHEADIANIRPLLQGAPVEAAARRQLLDALQRWAQSDRSLLETTT